MKKARVSRRIFVASSLALGLGILLYSSKDTKLKPFNNDVQVLLHAAYHLFPHSKLGPGAVDLHISNYLSLVLKDERILEEDRHYFLQGASWLEESAFETFEKSFINLTHAQKETLLQKVTQKRWGENFVYATLGYVFEALLCSPVYGSNPDGIGWKWLEHNPGFPQPTARKEISYEV